MSKSWVNGIIRAWEERRKAHGELPSTTPAEPVATAATRGQPSAALSVVFATDTSVRLKCSRCHTEIWRNTASARPRYCTNFSCNARFTPAKG